MFIIIFSWKVFCLIWFDHQMTRIFFSLQFCIVPIYIYYNSTSVHNSPHIHAIMPTKSPSCKSQISPQYLSIWFHLLSKLHNHNPVQSILVPLDASTKSLPPQPFSHTYFYNMSYTPPIITLFFCRVKANQKLKISAR